MLGNIFATILAATPHPLIEPIPAMALQPKTLHLIFFPFMAPGHMIPILDLARLFAARGAKATIVTTPFNAPTFLKPLQMSKNAGPPIGIEIIPFPWEEVGLPEGVESPEAFSSHEMRAKFHKATQMLQPSLELVLEKLKPNYLVADLLLPYATQAAKKFNIPRLVFHVFGCFPICCAITLRRYQPYQSVETDDEEFIIPHLPHVITSTRSQLSPEVKDSNPTYQKELLLRAFETEEQSYGIIVNSFYELEPEYADHYKNFFGRRKVWLVGPTWLCNEESKANKFDMRGGKESSIDGNQCLKWLDSKKPNSVIYICFGTMALFSDSQLREIAIGLEASGQNFIWVVRRDKDGGKGDDEWLPDGFEKRVEGRGLVIRGWAPQILILDHETVGGFLTHCGWNSLTEGVSCGIPMVTWPVFGEQFYNEKLVTEVLKIGVAVGAKKWSRMVEVSVKWEDIKDAVEKVMVSEEGLEMRNRAKKLKEMARQAVGESGSSYSDLNFLIQELGYYGE